MFHFSDKPIKGTCMQYKKYILQIKRLADYKTLHAESELYLYCKTITIKLMGCPNGFC